MATSNKSKKILEKARKIAAKTKKKKVSKVDVKKKTTSYPEGQNAPQSKKYTQESDKELPAKSTGWRWTKEGAKKLGKSVESKPTTSDIEKYRNETFKLKGKPNKSGPKGVGDGSHRYLYVERRADKADITRKNKLAKGGIMNRHIWEGWTVENFIDELSIEFNYHPKFKSRDEVKKWAMENQPYYKKYIPEVVDYYWEKNQREKYEDGGEMAKGGKANENEYIVSVEIENEYGKIIEFGVNVFANTEDEAMDKAEANIRENDSRYEDSSIDIVGVKLVKNKMAKGGSVEEKYEVELFFKGLSGENRKIGKYVVSQNTLDNLEDEWSHILSIDVIDESEKGSISWYNLKKEIYAKGKEKGLFADGGMMAKGGKIPSSEVIDFKKYVKQFYGKDEMYSEFFPPLGASNDEINLAVSQYIEYCKTKDDQWGGGDSFDREIVRDIMFYNRGTRKGLEYQRAIKEIFGKDKKEYGGILQPMIGGVNADPRFDIYNTTMFAKKGVEVPHGEKEQVKFFEIVNEIKNLEYDGDPNDRRLHSESRFYWGANNEDDYYEALKQINQIGIKGKGWEIYATYDSSGYDYWMKNQEEQNYIHIVVSFDKQKVHEDEIGKIESALYEAIMDAERISNAFDYDPSTSDDDDYAKGGKVSDTFKKAYDYGDREGYIRDFGSVELEVKGRDKEIKLVALAKIMNIYDATGDEQFEKTPYEVTFEIVPTLKHIDKKHIESAMDSSGVDELSSINYGDIFEGYMSGVPLKVDGETFKLFATYDEAKDYIYSKEVNDDITVSSRLVGFALDRPVNRIGTTGWSYLTNIVDKNHDPYKFAKGGSTHEQGYDDREDESLAMRHGKIASKDFVGSHARREHSRRDDARFEERHKKAYGGLTDSSIELLD